MQHLEEGTIHAWLDGALPPDEAALAESHVAGCAACAALVAEARGLVAASSRILTKLDEVPGDVVPITSAPSRRIARRRPWSAWPVRVAAGLLLMAGGAAVLTSNRTVWSPDAAVELKSEAALATDSAVPAAAPAPEAAAPVPSARPTAPAASTDVEASRTAARLSAAPAPPSAPRPMAVRAEEPVATGAAVGKVTAGAAGADAAEGAAADAASQAREAREERAAIAGTRQGAALQAPTQVTPAPQLAPEAITLSSATANAARQDSLAPAARVIAGWRLVSSAPVLLPTSVVRRTVYEVRPGVTVTLDESAPTTAPRSDGLLGGLARRRAAESATAPAAKSAPSPAPLAAPRADEAASDAGGSLLPPAGVNVLRWRSAAGTVMTLWGTVGIVELEELRGRLD